jgi:hypothetical protein
MLALYLHGTRHFLDYLASTYLRLPASSQDPEQIMNLKSLRPALKIYRSDPI